jgi:Ca2+-binding EF-hand superfamily protein
MMVSGILNCGKTLLWSVLLLCIITYIQAAFSLQVMSEWLEKAEAELDDERTLETVKFIDEHFTHLWWSMYTLLKVVAGGVNWGEIADPMQHISWLLLPAFTLYVVLCEFCVLNIITAAFVEAASRTAQEEDTSALEHLEEREAWIEQIKSLFRRHDSDNDGNLNEAEFRSIMADWRTQQSFRDIGLNFDFQHVGSLFKLFDFNNDKLIDINEFAQGVHQLKGNARSLDMFREFQQMGRKVERVARRTQKLPRQRQSDRPSPVRVDGVAYGEQDRHPEPL